MHLDLYSWKNRACEDVVFKLFILLGLHPWLHPTDHHRSQVAGMRWWGVARCRKPLCHGRGLSTICVCASKIFRNFMWSLCSNYPIGTLGGYNFAWCPWISQNRWDLVIYIRVQCIIYIYIDICMYSKYIYINIYV